MKHFYLHEYKNVTQKCKSFKYIINQSRLSYTAIDLPKEEFNGTYR